MTAVLVLLFGLAIGLTVLLLVESAERRLEARFPSYARAWDRIGMGDTPQPSHVQVQAHYPCKFCHTEGFHTEGCSYLDRLDAGEARR